MSDAISKIEILSRNIMSNALQIASNFLNFSDALTAKRPRFIS
jgi:hypothetical protein